MEYSDQIDQDKLHMYNVALEDPWWEVDRKNGLRKDNRYIYIFIRARQKRACSCQRGGVGKRLKEIRITEIRSDSFSYRSCRQREYISHYDLQITITISMKIIIYIVKMELICKKYVIIMSTINKQQKRNPNKFFGRILNQI